VNRFKYIDGRRTYAAHTQNSIYAAANAFFRPEIGLETESREFGASKERQLSLSSGFSSVRLTALGESSPFRSAFRDIVRSSRRQDWKPCRRPAVRGHRRLAAAVAGLATTLLIAGSTAAQAEAPGQTTAEFLKIEVGARAAGMAGAYASAGSDIFAAHYNPASIARMLAPQVGFQYNRWFADVDQNYLAGGVRLGEAGTVAASLNWISYGDMRRTTVTSGAAGTTVGTFEARDYALGLTWARPLSDRVDIGVTTKLIGTEIDANDGVAFAADAGFRYRVTDIWNVGASILNAGTELKLVRDGSPLPLGFRAGTSVSFLDEALVLSADLSGYRGEDVAVSIGAEYTFQKLVSIRVGYDSRNDDADEGLTAGAGFHYRDVDVDYAYTPFGDLGDAHRVSFNYAFASSARGLTAAPTTPSTREAVAAAPAVRATSDLRTSDILSREGQPAVPGAERLRVATRSLPSATVFPTIAVSDFRVIGLSERAGWVAQAAESILRDRVSAIHAKPNQIVRASLGVVDDRDAFLTINLFEDGRRVHTVRAEGRLDRFAEVMSDGADRLGRFVRTGEEELRFAAAAENRGDVR
jgi:hypothetical protein